MKGEVGASGRFLQTTEHLDQPSESSLNDGITSHSVSNPDLTASGSPKTQISSPTSQESDLDRSNSSEGEAMSEIGSKRSTDLSPGVILNPSEHDGLASANQTAPTFDHRMKANHGEDAQSGNTIGIFTIRIPGETELGFNHPGGIVTDESDSDGETSPQKDRNDDEQPRSSAEREDSADEGDASSEGPTGSRPFPSEQSAGVAEKTAQETTPAAAAPGPARNAALDVESKALVAGTSDKKATIVDVEKSKKESKKDRGSAWRQVLAAFVANLGTINTGLMFGFAAVANPQLRDPSSSIPVDEEQSSWIASLSSVTTPVGCLLGGYLMDRLGRRLTLILTEVPAILGLLLISLATDINMIYVGRLLVGLGSGMVGAPARVYTCEVTQPHLRGMLSALGSVGVSLGVLIEYSLGAAMSWYLMAGISAMIPILAFITIILMPESPNWLLQRGRTEEARASLKRLRGGRCDVDKELDTMMCFAAKNNVVRLKGFKETITTLLKPSTLKPFGLLFLYFLIYQFSGVNSITFYAVDVFRMSGTEMNKFLATVVLGVVRLISTILSCISLRRCGRRPLTLVSASGCGLTMLGLGIYLYLREGWIANGVEPVATWFPVACIFIFTIASTLGYLVVPWVMIGEVYPTQIRGIAGGITTCAAHSFVFMVVKTFPEFMKLFGIPGTFMMYGGISLFGILFFYFCLPETKGRSLQEIEDYFCGRVKKIGERCPSTVKMPQVLDIQKGNVLP